MHFTPPLATFIIFYSFIKVSVTYSKLYMFKMYNLMSLVICPDPVQPWAQSQR